MTRATLLRYTKRTYRDGAVAEVKIWGVPSSVSGSRHRFKYSLFYGRGGDRLVGYDNERGKGDHRHYGDTEEAYSFTSLRRLLADYRADVGRLRRGKKL